jgi:hypothetical protein
MREKNGAGGKAELAQAKLMRLLRLIASTLRSSQ